MAEKKKGFVTGAVTGLSVAIVAAAGVGMKWPTAMAETRPQLTKASVFAPPVGAPMYAIGSPLGETLAGTFTQGVLSGVRDFNGTRFFQSDVSINHGNSGGPMLDGNSRVVGLADLHIDQASGLSFFVPMKDALDRLAVVIDEPAATP